MTGCTGSGGDNRRLEEKLRWQSRRGWLELDLLLDSFWRKYGGELSQAELTLLDDWLAKNDEDLWHTLHSPPPANGGLAQKIIQNFTHKAHQAKGN